MKSQESEGHDQRRGRSVTATQKLILTSPLRIAPPKTFRTRNFAPSVYLRVSYDFAQQTQIIPLNDTKRFVFVPKMYTRSLYSVVPPPPKNRFEVKQF